MSKRAWGVGAGGVLVGLALGMAAAYSWIKAKPQAPPTEERRMARAIATHLMFEGVAEKAMNLYVSLFKGSEIKRIERYGPGEQGAEGTIKRADFILGGHPLICIDSPIKHAFTFTPSMSIFVDCESEAELNEAFKQLSDGGQVLMPLDNYGFSKRFGWLKDRFGVSWQLNLQ
jgi:predicted 3-demethylubiquinone-9 3-methyltransferase (glyoxalase superfamily)